MEYHFNRLDEPVFMAGPKPMLLLTEFAINHRLESCVIRPLKEIEETRSTYSLVFYAEVKNDHNSDCCLPLTSVDNIPLTDSK